MDKTRYCTASSDSVKSWHSFLQLSAVSENENAAKGQRFDDVQMIETNATNALKAMPKSEYQDCFQKWKRCWERERVIKINGDCFEGCHKPDHVE